MSKKNEIESGKKKHLVDKSSGQGRTAEMSGAKYESEKRAGRPGVYTLV